MKLFWSQMAAKHIMKIFVSSCEHNLSPMVMSRSIWTFFLIYSWFLYDFTTMDLKYSSLDVFNTFSLNLRSFTKLLVITMRVCSSSIQTMNSKNLNIQVWFIPPLFQDKLSKLKVWSWDLVASDLSDHYYEISEWRLCTIWTIWNKPWVWPNQQLHSYQKKKVLVTSTTSKKSTEDN